MKGESKNNNNNDIENKKHQQEQEQQEQLSLSTQAYKLFSEGKYSNTSRRCIKPKRVRDNQILQRVLQAKPNARPQYCI